MTTPANCPHSTPNCLKSLLVLPQVPPLSVLSYIDSEVSQDEL